MKLSRVLSKLNGSLFRVDRQFGLNDLTKALDQIKPTKEEFGFDDNYALKIEKEIKEEKYKRCCIITKKETKEKLNTCFINNKKRKHECILVFLIICLLSPFVFLSISSNRQNNKQHNCYEKSSLIQEKHSNDTLNNQRSFLHDVVDGEHCLRGCIDDKQNIVKKRESNSNIRNSLNYEFNIQTKDKRKDTSTIDLFLGLSALLLMLMLSFFIYLYIKYLQKIREQEYSIEKDILEYNKRVKLELLRLETAKETLYKQYIEQQLELNKKAVMIKQEEIQQFLDHNRKCDMKVFEMKAAYLNKITEMFNKTQETQRIDKKEEKVEVVSNSDVRFSIEKKP